jgi:hypothetical protein
MSNAADTTQVDEGKLNSFIGQMLNDLGGASSIAMVRMGDARLDFTRSCTARDR